MFPQGSSDGSNSRSPLWTRCGMANPAQPQSSSAPRTRIWDGVVTILRSGTQLQACYGMPECRTVVLESLQRGYATLSVTALLPDWPIVSTIVKEWRSQYSLYSLPVTAWGHSNGTYLVTFLTQTLPIRAMVLTCGEGDLWVQAVATPLNFPPTLFVYVPRDASFPELDATDKDERAMAMLLSRGVEVANTQCWPKPLSPLFFTERILCMSEQMSQRVYAALEAAGWIDSNGYLKKNPGVEDFESVLLKANALPYCAASGELCLIGHVKQELSMAFAVHSFTSDANDVIFPWLYSHILSSSGAAIPDSQSPALIAMI